jgi:GNAT superfamily N-acetyltransferase
VTHILTDFSTEALSEAIKTNLHGFFCYIGSKTQTEPFADSSLTRWHTLVPFEWFNGALASRPVKETDAELVRETIAWFKARSVKEFTWWLNPTLPRSDWEALLLAHGFRFSSGPPGMAVDLRAINENGAVPAGFQIVPVTDTETLRVWAHTFNVGYGMPADWETPLLKMMTDIELDLPVRNYLGYLDGKPVATSNLFLGAGVAGVQCVATLPEARGKGLGGAMSLAPLFDARQMGYRIGSLQASDMGYPVYLRLGFEQVCQVEHFYWTGEA